MPLTLKNFYRQWWKPWANTRLYLPLNSTDNFTDKSWNSYTVTNVGNVQLGTYGWVDCAYFTSATNSYATLNNFAFNSDTNWTISFWEYYIDWQYPSTFASTSNVWFWKSFKIWPITNDQFAYEVSGANWDGWWTQSSLVVDNTMSYKNVRCHYCLVMDWVENNVAHFKAYINNNQVSHFDTWKWYYTSTRPNYCFGSDPYSWVGWRLWRFYLSNFIIENKSWTAQERSDYFDQTKSLYWIS